MKIYKEKIVNNNSVKFGFIYVLKNPNASYKVSIKKLEKQNTHMHTNKLQKKAICLC
jgi:hypothetical protein